MRGRARPHVGYYAHHVGAGHRHRALSLSRDLLDRGTAVTVLSSMTPDEEWVRDDGAAWVRLERDDQPAPGSGADETGHGRLHWVPQGHDGLRRRAAQLSAWIAETRPDLIVSDVSQEVAVLARLHGVPVVSVLLPGRRDDPAHALGLGLSEEVVAFWPPRSHLAGTGAGSDLPDDVASRVRALGGHSRFAPVTGERPRRPRHLVVLAGTGGGAAHVLAAGEAALGSLGGWTGEVLGGSSWVTSPFEHLREADVVLTHAGQNAIAEVAAARVPAVVVAQERPFGEQRATARVLTDDAWPAVVVDAAGGSAAHTGADWADLVGRASSLDGDRWQGWVDGGAAGRFADLVEAAVGRTRAAR